LLLAGCSSVPEKIRTAPLEAPTLTQVRQAPETHTGSQVRWGGTIARVENRQDETRIEIVARALRGDGEPKQLDSSEGRFIARIRGFLDPAIFAEGRRLTVVGSIDEVVERQLGQMRYRYPLLEVEAYYLWPPPLERTAPDDPWLYDPWYPWRRYPYYYY
jgi:outer membrane lipoprotein